MSQPTAALDDELGIPSDATLKVPTQIPRPLQLLLIPPQDMQTDFITVASPSSSNADDQSLPGCLSTHISSESSMRGDAARSLIVGRQASSADIRIDHKSVSRRHTAIYYKNVGSNADAENEGAPVLVVRDLGGKHGTHVNDNRLEKNGQVELPLRGNKEHIIRIGNAPLTCRVIVPASKLDEQQSTSHLQQEAVAGEENVLQKSHQENIPTKDAATDGSEKEAASTETEDVPHTRESREAQIAAMIASLDSNPVYKKYTPLDEENGVTESMSNLATDTKSNGTSDNINNNIMHKKTNTNKYNLPITSSITLTPGSNNFTSSDGTNTPLQSSASVSALRFEPSGARLVAGHRDGTLRFYDFHGMQPSSTSQTVYPPFRIVDSDNDPLDNTGRHILTALAPSATGGQWIVGTTSASAKVLDREGRTTLFHFLKGDTYVTDSSATKGHTAGVTGVSFHPLVKETCYTCGLDGSIRQWDVGGRGKTQFQKLVCQKVVGKCKNEKGQRTQIVSNLSVHPSGRKIVVGTACGSIQIWNCFGSGVNSRPLGAIYSAHGGTKPVTFVTFSGNGERIASRSDSDDTVRIWDANRIEKGTGSFGRKFSSRGKEGEHPPSLLLAICNGLPALNESANCTFGPDGKILCAGTAVDPRARKSADSSNACGKLKFYQLPEGDKRSKVSKESGTKSSSKTKSTAILDPIVELDVAPNASVLGVQWHPKLNQIALGTSDGIIQVLYDPILSTKGALMPTSRAVRQSDGLSDLLRSRVPTGSAAFLSSANSTIINPNALPLFREEPRATRKTKENERKDPEKTKLPQPPVSGGIRTGGKLGGGINFAQYIKTANNYVNNKNIAGKDPREELFKYNEGKSYVSKAYEGDIQRILAEKTVEEEEAELKSGNKRQKTK